MIDSSIRTVANIYTHTETVHASTPIARLPIHPTIRMILNYPKLWVGLLEIGNDTGGGGNHQIKLNKYCVINDQCSPNKIIKLEIS